MLALAQGLSLKFTKKSIDLTRQKTIVFSFTKGAKINYNVKVNGFDLKEKLPSRTNTNTNDDWNTDYIDIAKTSLGLTPISVSFMMTNNNPYLVSIGSTSTGIMQQFYYV